MPNTKEQLLKNILKKTDSLQKEIRTKKPLSPDLEETLQERLRIEWTYNSNAIEGNTLTFGETAFFLREGLTAEGKPLKDYLETRNHSEVIYGLMDIIQKKRELTEGVIKELHSILLKGIEFTYAKGAQGIIKKPIHPGQYKLRPNHVLTLSGRIHYYTDPIHVKDEMEKLIKWYKKAKNLHPVEMAAIFHYKFVNIHPFDDGNGRMARLLMNLILMQTKYPPCIIQNSKRRKYLEMLEICDETKDCTPFILFIANELMATQETILNIFKKPVDIFKEETSLNKEQRENLIIETLNKSSQSISQILQKNPRFIRSTLKKDLKRLVDLKRIKSKGTKKGTIYYLK